MLSATFALTYCGLSSLSLAMNRHAREAFGRDITRLQALGLRLIGTCTLALALVLTAHNLGWPMGTVAWIGMLTASAMAVLLLHSYRAQSMLRVSFWLVVCAGALALPA